MSTPVPPNQEGVAEGPAPPEPSAARGEIRGERGIAPLNPPTGKRWSSLLLGLVSLVILGLLVWTLPQMPAPKSRSDRASSPLSPDSERRPYRDQDVTLETTQSPIKSPPLPPTFAPPPIPRIDPAAAPAAPEDRKERALTPAERRLQGGVTAIAAPGAAAGSRQPTAALRPLSPALFSARGGADPNRVRTGFEPGSAVPAAAQALRQGADAGPDAPGGSVGEEGDTGSSDAHAFAAQLRGTRTTTAEASRLPSMTLMLASGRYFECVLDTAVSSIIAGQVRCTLPYDVYGEDGRVVLLDRGTEIRGEYRSDMRRAQRRLGILWMRAKTPAGVVIALESPASDTLGRAGVDGFVETYFWERFGAAIMLSTLDDALAAALRGGGGDTIYYNNATRTVQRTGEIALENSINIRPTLVKNQGETVQIALARDLDFRKVYGFRQLGLR